jgi:hypothetical protein
MKKFAFVFTVGGRIVWSGEDEANICRRVKNESLQIQADVDQFIHMAEPGDFYVLEPYGEMIIRMRD